MSLKDKLLNIVTLGAHARMQSAFDQYDTAYIHYYSQFQVAQQLERKVSHELAQLGRQVQQTLALVAHSQQLLSLQQPSRRIAYAAQPQTHSVAGAQRLLQQHQSFVLPTPAHSKARIHIQITTGVWGMTLPQHTAPPSTIWDSLVIHQLPVIPRWQVAWWDRYVSVQQLQQKTQELLDVQQPLDQIVNLFAAHLHDIEQRRQMFCASDQQLRLTYQRIYRQLFPLRWLSHLYRSWRQLLGYGYVAKHEQALLSELDLVLYDVIDSLHPAVQRDEPVEQAQTAIKPDEI